MKIKGVIFDLDGVIVSTDGFHYRAWKKLADEEGIYFDENINNRLRGVSRMESLEIILERAHKSYTDEEKVEMATKKNNYYVEYLSYLNEDNILPNVLHVLDELKKNNIKIAIGSSSKNTPLILKRIGLYNYFDAVSDGNDIKNSKPDPEVFLIAAQRLNLLPEECAVIEDAKSGIDAAKRGGMIAIAISDAFSYERADFSLKNIGDLLYLIQDNYY